MTSTPSSPDVVTAKAKSKLKSDIQAFKHAITNADVEYVGRDTEYVPESPRLRETHPNANE